MQQQPIFCRDCLHLHQTPPTIMRCPHCGGPRLVQHPELTELSIAHVDCDAFYAAVEKRDNPALRDRPLIIGGTGARSVVSTACYIARIYGVHSAMPMYLARKACPDAVILPPEMKKYVSVSRDIRRIFLQCTPLVEPLSLDEAFLDLSGTQRLHKKCPAQTLAALAARIETDIGITVSIGLSYNKFLAKVASDLDKPKGFSVIGRAEARTYLSTKPLSIIWGAGPALQRKLASDGITTVGQLQNLDEKTLVRRYGAIGQRLARFALGEDDRSVNPSAPAKSVSAERTFAKDLITAPDLLQVLWPLCEDVSQRLKDRHLAGQTLVLKLRTNQFRLRTRNRKLSSPTQLAERLFQTAKPLIIDAANATPYRLLGIGVTNLCDPALADPVDLVNQTEQKLAAAERSIDSIRTRFGITAIKKGRSLT